MLSLILSLLISPAFASEKPANSKGYHCQGSGYSAEILDAFDDNWQRLYTTAVIQSKTFEYAGFVQAESLFRADHVYITWKGPNFELVGRFEATSPNRNFLAELRLPGQYPGIQLSCTY